MATPYENKEPMDEERKGLLSGHEEPLDGDKEDYHDTNSREWSRNKVVCAAVSLIALLIFGAFAPVLLFGRVSKHQDTNSNRDELMCNGTHFFKKTVLIMSIDALRADYLDRNLTPHLVAISKKGLRAKSMRPIFPTLTFPNHWALMTGLHAESHGIVANDFYDPVSNSMFHKDDRENTIMKPRWWQGEPMWETAHKAGLITANLMWVGPGTTMRGVSPDYWIPWKRAYPLQKKLDQLLSWIDLPLEKRPQLIMGYEDSVDEAGHNKGPNSKLVNQTLVDVDIFARDLHDALAMRNLSDIVDVVFVSDHGMTGIRPEIIYLDDLIGTQGLHDIAHLDGWPCMGLRFASTANETHYLELLLKGARQNPEKFSVYTRETMPERYHFKHNERISPIYIVPNIGYALSTRAKGNVGFSTGIHGYSNEYTQMQAIFVAHGPFVNAAKVTHQSQSNGLLSRFLSRASKGWHSTSDGTYILEPFSNTEIYNLIMKLLGISSYAAPTNGTAGFWDAYF